MSLIPKNQKIDRTGEQKIKALIYGKPMSGKTTLAVNFPNALILSTDGNYKATDVPAIDIHPTTNELNGKIVDGFTYVQEVIKSLVTDTQYETIIIDLIDDIVDMSDVQTAVDAGVDYIGDIPHGKG
jgi:stage III sporulation protein SpoIIIAA